MTDFDADKAAHLFYGMSEAMYDQGLRFDWERIQTRRLENGNIRYTMPILMPDGSPWVMKDDRPHTWGIMTGIKPSEPDQLGIEPNTKTNVPE